MHERLPLVKLFFTQTPKERNTRLRVDRKVK